MDRIQLENFQLNIYPVKIRKQLKIKYVGIHHYAIMPYRKTCMLRRYTRS